MPTALFFLVTCSAVWYNVAGGGETMAIICPLISSSPNLTQCLSNCALNMDGECALVKIARSLPDSSPSVDSGQHHDELSDLGGNAQS